MEQLIYMRIMVLIAAFPAIWAQVIMICFIKFTIKTWYCGLADKKSTIVHALDMFIGMQCEH